MNKTFYRSLLLIAGLSLLLTACGRKEMPQVVASDGPPEIAQLNVESTFKVVRMNLRLKGGHSGIGYQIDRAELDPYCNCPDRWQRYFEQQPSPLNADKEIVKVFRTEQGDHQFLYRLRAIDGEGRLGTWSKVIHTEVQPKDE